MNNSLAATVTQSNPTKQPLSATKFCHAILTILYNVLYKKKI